MTRKEIIELITDTANIGRTSRDVNTWEDSEHFQGLYTDLQKAWAIGAYWAFKLMDQIDEENIKPDPEYKELGLANLWHTTPAELENCRKLHHQVTTTSLNSRNTYHEYKCEICKIKYRIDSSD